MHEKPLLLPSAKSGVLVPSTKTRYTRVARFAVLGIGLACVLVGAADVSTRAVQSLGEGAATVAFAPAATLATATSSSMSAFVPARLRMPALGVDAKVESVGIKEDGSMGTPKDFNDVGWFALGAKPGGPGSAVFAGHVNNALTKAGVFAHLSQVQKGDYITLSNEAGRTQVYRVSSIEEYPADAPTDRIFATSGPSQIVLITCEGEWVPSARTFEKRLVVIAKPAY